MILIIDAYNVLKQVLPSVQIGDRERAKFIEELGRYARYRQHKIILVFDGGPYDRSTQERCAGIYVVYAGWLESADDYIKRYVQKHRELDLIVVSSDREVRSAADRLGIESVPALEFYERMKMAFAEQASSQTQETQIVKTSEASNIELDALMHEGSRVVHKKVDDVTVGRQDRLSRAQRLSKKERKKNKKTSKL
jgi:predicted RNA-binding protein with PIN domain